MADKSFGDYPNRNIVKNPLLSSAVTGMSLEDLTHNAVLLPVPLTQEVITPPDEQNRSHITTLASTEHTASNLPAGDANSNPFLQSTSHTTPINPYDINTSQKTDQRTLRPQFTQPKASVKSEDDFDVNEYFARLHGTRYVSAPLNSNLKEDKTANLEATEENLEEINLNEPEKEVNPQQSLTADIAQNFSQLPTVLPQMASAMFSSFSNMLQTRKSREATPDVSSGYQEVHFERPEPSPMVAPPPREPPTLPPSIGTANYRLPPKKKYAQIPGLSSERTSQTPFQPQNQNMPPTHQNTPQYFIPSSDTTQNQIQSLQNNYLNQSNIPTYFVPSFDKQQTIESIKQSGEAQLSSDNIAKRSVTEVDVDIFANKPVSSQPQFYSQDVTSVPQGVLQSRDLIKKTNVDIFANKAVSSQPQFYSQDFTQSSVPQGVLQSKEPVKEANVDIFANIAVSSQPQFYSQDVTQPSVPQGVLQSKEPVKEANVDIFANKAVSSQPQFYNQDVTKTSVTEGMLQSRELIKEANVDIFGNNPPLSQPHLYSQDVTQTSETQGVLQSKEPVKEANVDIFANKAVSSQPQFYNQDVTKTSVTEGILQSRELVKEANVDIFGNNPPLSQPQCYNQGVTKTSVTEGMLQSRELVKEANFDIFGNNPPLSQPQFYGQDVTQTSVPQRVLQSKELVQEANVDMFENKPPISQPQFYIQDVTQTSETQGVLQNIELVKKANVDMFVNKPPLSQPQFYSQDVTQPSFTLPPPPIFTNLPRRDSQSGVEKSILPPSVARRVSSNRPTIKQTTSLPQAPTNIYIPTPVEDTVQQKTSSQPAFDGEFSSVPISAMPSSLPPSARQIPALISTSTPAALQSSADKSAPSTTPQFSTENSLLLSQTIKKEVPPGDYIQPATSVPVSIFTPTSIPSHHQEPRFQPPTVKMPPSKSQGFSQIPTSVLSPDSKSQHPVTTPLAPATMYPPSNKQMLPPSIFTPQTTSTSAPNIQTPSGSNLMPNLSGPSQISLQHPTAPAKTKEFSLIDNRTTPGIEQQKPVPEPPKAVGNVNFRMTKKRPQYYSGPIGGVGDISNNVKPVMPPLQTVPVAASLMSGGFQGDMFIPTGDHIQMATENIPFDISKPAEPNPTVDPTPQTQVYATAFDFSRPTTENYSEPKQESTGFGLLGSLKSKLTSLDINKIQSTVTTFFDPAYNDVKKESSQPGRPQDNFPYEQPKQYQSSNNFEIFVPNVEQTNPNYNQSYLYQMQFQNQFDYSQQQHAYLSHEPHNYYQNQGYHGQHYQSQDQNISNYFGDTSHIYQTPIGPTTINQPTHPHNTLPTTTEGLKQNESVPEIQQTYFANPNYQSQDSIQAQISSESGSEIKEQHPHISSADISKASLGDNQDIISNTNDDTSANFFDNISHDQVIQSQPQNVLDTSNLSEQNINLGIDSSNYLFENSEPDIKSDKKVESSENVGRISVESLENAENKVIEAITENLEIRRTESEYSHKLEEMPIIGGFEIKDNKCEQEEIVPSLEKNSSIGGGSSYFDSQINESVSANSQATHQVCPTQPKTDEYKPSDIISTNIKDVMFKLQNNPADFFGSFNQAEVSRENSFSQLLIDCKNEISKEEQKKHEVITEFSENSPEISTSSAPLLGLSNMLADKTKELNDLQDEMKDLAIREPSDGEALFKRTANVTFVENVRPEVESDHSDLSICETCREIDRPDDVEDNNDLTTRMIENITSTVLLENAVEVPLSESNADVQERGELDSNQCEVICQITENTIETIQVQSATELLDAASPRDNGWSTDKISNVPTTIDECSYQLPSFQTTTIGNEFSLPINANSIGFFGNNNLFENITTNIGADLKAEFKDKDNVLNVLSRQMSIPSAPLEEDTKSDMLDVHSIEQDASKDFPIIEEYVIEPSKDTDDEKEDERRGSGNKESFTSRVDKFKKKEDILPPEKTSPIFSLSISPGKKMASYFDTGNYAVETHYRNSLTSPSSITNQIRVPPGFEEEFQRRMSIQDGRPNLIKDTEPSIPDTTTQTRLTYSPTFTTAQSLSALSSYDTTSLMASNQYLTDATTKLPDYTSTFGTKGSPDFKQISLLAELSGKSIDFLKNLQEEPTDILQHEKTEETPPEFSFLEAKKDEVALKPTLGEKEPQDNLSDPVNFFGEDTKSPPKTVDQGFNRLASYFSSPAKTDHSKSFFELSQSENHYRNKPETNTLNTNTENLKENIPPDQYLANLNLMRDLTSVQNVDFKPETIVRTVNYFTVEYDNAQMLTELRIDEPVLKKESSKNIETPDNTEALSDEILANTLRNCKHCSDISLGHVRKFDAVRPESMMVYNVRKCMDSNETEGKKHSIKMNEDTKHTENSVTTKFGHDLGDDHNEGVAVSSENRVVGEYIPVRHHWFYRVDADEKSLWRGFSVADSKALEQAFLSPNLTDETVVPTDGGRYDVNVKGRLRYAVYWSDKPSNVRRCSWFYKGTTDVRYVPYTESVAETLEEEYRRGMTTGEWHRRLVLPNNEMVVMHGPGVMVHFLQAGTAAAFSAPPQTTSRPRVVRRGYDESEIEESEPSKMDHLLLLCHGVGSACDMRLRNVEEVVDDFRATSLQLIQSHYKNSFDSGLVGRVEVLPISWHATLHSGETGVDKRLAKITLDSIPKLRNFTNDTVLDVLFYTSPVFCQTILNTVCAELNRIYKLFRARNPEFKGGVSLGGHSLGSVILYDLLCHQQPKFASPSPLRKQVMEGPAGTGQPSVQYPTLEFGPDALYALGSPIAIFECIRGVEELGRSFRLPSCNKFFNIFHPYDPIAYRIEPLINSELQDVKPFLIPHHKGRKRMHLELRDTMARVGADIKQKLIESIKSTWYSMWKTQPSDATLEKVVEEELEKEHLTEVPKEKDDRPPHEVTPDMLGKLNGGRRVDYVLQEAPLELINEYLFAMSSHVGYWESEDTMLLMLKEIYDSLGVQPDCTVPQANLTVQRTRIQDEIGGGATLTEYPSTSKGEGL